MITQIWALSQKIITILLFSVIVAYGQKQEYKASGVKWSYDKLTKTERYYTPDSIMHPLIRGFIYLKNNDDKSIELKYSSTSFKLSFKTVANLDLVTINKIVIFNKDYDNQLEIKEITADAKWNSSSYGAGWYYNIECNIGYNDIQKLKEILEKYKKVNVRVYTSSGYVDYGEGWYPISGGKSLFNLIDIYNKIHSKQSGKQ